MFRGRLGHMLGALDLTRPIVRADKAMQAETMVHIGEEGGEQLREGAQCAHSRVSTHSSPGKKLSRGQCPGCTTVYASFSHKIYLWQTAYGTTTFTCFNRSELLYLLLLPWLSLSWLLLSLSWLLLF